MKNKSHTVALFPILIALNKFLDRGIGNFQPASEDAHDQKFAIGLMDEALKIKYSEDEIKSFISNDVHELNSILKQNGYDIQLDESIPVDLGVVTIMDLIGRWLEQGVHVIIEHENESYPAVKIKSGASIINFFDDKEKHILMIRTREGLCVFIQKDEQERSGMDLFKHILEKSNSLPYNEMPCDATIPFVDIDEQPDISWLMGMKSTIGGDFTINQALQQNKLKINADGIHAQSAVAIGTKRGMIFEQERPQFVIDGPFNLWIAYGNPEHKYFPLFAAHVAPDSWKAPK